MVHSPSTENNNRAILISRSSKTERSSDSSTIETRRREKERKQLPFREKLGSSVWPGFRGRGETRARVGGAAGGALMALKGVAEASVRESAYFYRSDDSPRGPARRMATRWPPMRPLIRRDAPVVVGRRVPDVEFTFHL